MVLLFPLPSSCDGATRDDELARWDRIARHCFKSRGLRVNCFCFTQTQSGPWRFKGKLDHAEKQTWLQGPSRQGKKKSAEP